jgi:hypothetical protein
LAAVQVSIILATTDWFFIHVLPAVVPVRPVLAPGLVVPAVVARRPVLTPGLVVPVVEVQLVLAPGLVVPVVEVRRVLAPGLVVPVVEVPRVIAPWLVVPVLVPDDLSGVARVRMARLSCRKVSTTTRRPPVVLVAIPAVLNWLCRNLPPGVRVLLPVTLPCRRRRMLLRPKIRRLEAAITAVDSIALRPLVAAESPQIMLVVWRVP